MLTAVILTLMLGIVWTGVLGAGAILTWRGVRGKPIDNLPRCRRCKYNVGHRRNRPHRCPECGANLQLLGSIRLGARRMQGSLVTWGVMLVLIGLSPIGVLVWRAMPRAVPAVTAAVPAPVSRPAPVWSLFAAGRAEKKAGARLKADAEPAAGPLVPIETGPIVAATSMISLELLAAHPIIDRPLESTTPLGGYFGGTHVEPFRVEMQPAEPGGPDLHAALSERAGLSPWSYRLDQRSAWTGSIDLNDPFVGVGTKTGLIAGPGRAISLQRTGPTVISGNRISGGLTHPQTVLGGSTSIRGSGAWSGFSGGLNSHISPGVGNGFDLRVTQPASVMPPIPSGLPGGP